MTRLFLTLVLLSAFLLPSFASAQTNNPFGGLIVFKWECQCSNNTLLYVAPPKPDLPTQLIFGPSSILYEFKKLDIGQYVLGTWLAPAVCLVPGPPAGCGSPIEITSGQAKLIYMVGTSGGNLSDDTGEEEPETDDFRCSDGQDNDGDGLIDYPDDPGCNSDRDDSEEDDECTCACDADDEDDTRARLSEIGISVNKGPCPRNDPDNPCRSTSTGGGRFSCTNVACLPRTAVDKLAQLKSESGCAITITGGTEPGHSTHGQCIAVVDMRFSRGSCLNDFIESNASGSSPHSLGTIYNVPGYGMFLDESAGVRHWHVRLQL